MGKIKFSGAHCDEHGKISGGVVGDQTGREVCTKDAYMHSKGWVVLRHPDAAIAKKVAKFAKAIADNNNFGYDQSQRTTGYTATKKAGWNPAKVKTKVEIDCSETVRTAVACALGKDIPDFNTELEKSVLLKQGFKEVKSWSLSTLQTGDILVTPTKGHTEVCSQGVKPKISATKEVKKEKPKTSTFKSYKVKVTADSLNVRKKATTKSDVIKTIKKNTIHTITKESDGWGKISDGWINLKYVDKC